MLVVAESDKCLLDGTDGNREDNLFLRDMAGEQAVTDKLFEMVEHRPQRRIHAGGNICFGVGSVSHLLVPIDTAPAGLTSGHRGDARHGARKRLYKGAGVRHQDTVPRK
jgi:hypothetical protein